MGRWRLAGVILLLLVQTALAVFLGFLATIHWEESNRFHLKLGLEFTPKREAALRCTMEEIAAFADALAVGVFTVVLLLAVAKANQLPCMRSAFRISGGSFLFIAAGLFFAAFGVPRVGSPHDDMFAGLGFFLSSAPVLLMSGCSFGIARLLKAPSSE